MLLWVLCWRRFAEVSEILSEEDVSMTQEQRELSSEEEEEEEEEEEKEGEGEEKAAAVTVAEKHNKEGALAPSQNAVVPPTLQEVRRMSGMIVLWDVRGCASTAHRSTRSSPVMMLH